LSPDGPARPSRLGTEISLDDAVIARLSGVCAEVDAGAGARLAAGRDWWPIAMRWAVEETVPSRPAVVCRPSSAGEVAAVLRVCHDARLPVTAFAGGSGVCGASIPVFGGIALDVTGLAGIAGVDDSSLLVDVRAGTFGDVLEDRLRADHGLTIGHWPQSVALSTVGGWVACRGAGQYSTRYGKIEDMVAGLEVALADGRLIRTGGTAPRAATGPDLSQLFVGSEGTLGVITEVRLRAHPRPPAERRAAYRFPDFAAGLDACRRILRRGATPAVLRLYDEVESERSFEIDGAALIVLDEGDAGLIEAVMRVVADEASGGEQLDAALVGRWLEHRNELPPLESLVRAGIVADTIEIAASWRALPRIYGAAIDGLRTLEATIAASAHQSHSYTDGGCLYFTFAGRPDDPGVAAAEAYYVAAWDAVMSATAGAGGALSHHHGIGLNRGRYLPAHLGGAWDVLTALKSALDPHQILNPGKLGLPSPFGVPPWPSAGRGKPSAFW
jgi:alkyldihydroxyacetonephosphate synthase